MTDLQGENGWKIFTSQVKDLTSPRFQFAIQHVADLSGAHGDYSEYVGGVMNDYLVAMATAGDLKGMDRYKEVLHALLNSNKEIVYDQTYALHLGFWRPDQVEDLAEVNVNHVVSCSVFET